VKQPSLRQRLLWLVGIPLVLAWLLTGLWIASRIVHETREMFDEELLRTAASVLAVMADSPRDGAAPTSRDDEDAGVPSISLRDASGRLLLHHGELPALAFDPGEAHFHTLTHASRRWRVYQRWDAGKRYWLQLAAPLDQRDELLGQLARALLLPLAGLLAMLPLAIAIGLRLGLAPLRRLSRAIGRNPALAPVLSRPDIPAELLPLTQALDMLVANLDRALQRERGFTADAAHELRHPLSVLQLELDLAGAAASADERQRHLDRAHAGLSRMERLVGQLLVLSRVDNLAGLDDAAPLDLHEVLAASLREVSQRALGRGVDLSLEGARDVRVQGSAGLLAIAFGNLLDNAIRHAQGRVTVALEAGDAHVEVVVEDDGRGFDAASVARLGERFHRPPGSSGNGSGLGLSIVRAVAALHGGELELGQAEDGGARAILRLPLAAAVGGGIEDRGSSNP
jgi:signal transduction histidine kinase